MPYFGLGVFQTPPEMTSESKEGWLIKVIVGLDMAAAYRNEEGVGEASEGRKDIFVTTKLWNADHGSDQALRAFEESTRKLRRHTLDLDLIHWPVIRGSTATCRAGKRWSVSRAKAGSARSADPINRDHLERIHRRAGFMLRRQSDRAPSRFQQKALRAFHATMGSRTESWSPLGRGPLLSEAAIVDIAAKHGKKPPRAVIRWHLESGLIVDSQNGEARTLKGKHRRARLPSR